MTASETAIEGLTTALFRDAVDLFLNLAYPGGTPAGVREVVGEVCPDGRLSLDSRLFEITAGVGGDEGRLRVDLRLGWHRFRHLKITIESAPDGRGPLFSVNTHDRALIRPSDDPEADAIRDLIHHNGAFKEKVERAWESAGIPTFKSWLRSRMRRPMR